MARGNPREITESARGVAEQLSGIGSPADIAHQRIGEQVRQMAYGREYLVVLLRRHARNARADRAPERGNGFDVLCPVFRKWRKHYAAALKQSRIRRCRPAAFRAGDRMRRNELGDLSAQCRTRGRRHVALGAAGVCDQRRGFEYVLYLLKDIPELSNRSRNQYEVCIPDGGRNAGCDRIDDAALQRELQVGGTAPDAHDMPAEFFLFRCQRKRTPDQANSDDRDPFEEHYSFRLAASADSRRSFSRAVPIVMRRCSGSW